MVRTLTSWSSGAHPFPSPSQPKVLLHIDVESPGVICLQERGGDLGDEGEGLLVVDLSQEQWCRVIGQLPVRVAEIVTPGLTRESDPSILDLGLSGGLVERAGKGNPRQFDVALFSLHILGKRLAGGEGQQQERRGAELYIHGSGFAFPDDARIGPSELQP